jgi:hypothetical protein
VLVGLTAGDLPAAWLAGQPALLPVLPARGTPPSVKTSLERLPLAFEPNAGQADHEALFLARTPQGALLFARDAVMLARRPPAGTREPHAGARAPDLRLQFLGASPATRLAAVDPQPGHVSYFTGNDPAHRQTGLPLYGGLRYTELYPGIDLLYEGGSESLKGTFRLAPGADPASIRWRYDGARRGDRPVAPTLDADGNLLINLPETPLSGTTQHAAPSTQHFLTEGAPVAWQERDGARIPVAVRYALRPDGTLGFAVGSYDPRLPLVIDPILSYAGYFGGVGWDWIWGMATDDAGNLYLTGITGSPDFPLRDPLQPVLGGGFDAFVSKLDPTGSTLLFSTYQACSTMRSGPESTCRIVDYRTDAV